MSAMEIAYTEFVTEYRFALGFWSETKALYPMNSREVFQATFDLEQLENKLIQYRLFRPIPVAA